MAKITVNRENFKVDERDLEQGTLTIGRHPDNSLRIDDPAVSNRHAQIVTVFDSSYVEDLNSTNGTFVNGKKIKTHTLHNGDVLTIGHYQILFQSRTAAAAPDANATMMIGVSQLEQLTQKARQNKPASKKPSPPRAHKTSAAPGNGKPHLKVHENQQPPLAEDNIELPDIDDSGQILERTQQISPTPPLHNRRKSDTSPLPSLKVIVLAVLATVATFTLLMLIFK
ncbi:MAG TPA: FHA domain-containing protein [Gammaproteobacteria bacterium]|nr:FHA domain-containing protein [Gammaproteobacteria bacterium]